MRTLAQATFIRIHGLRLEDHLMIADPVQHEAQLENREHEQAERDPDLEEPEAAEGAKGHPKPSAQKGALARA